MPRFDELINAIPPEEVMQKLNLIAKITNRSPSFLTRELKEIVCSPDCMIFPTIDDMHRAALRILIAKYKHRMTRLNKPDMEFYVIDKTSTKTYETYRPILEDHPTDLAKIEDRKIKNAERIAAGKKTREYKPDRVRKIPTGEEEKVTVYTASVFGIFAKYGLFKNDVFGGIFDDSFRTNIAELILEGEECRLLYQNRIENGKCYTIRCNAWFVDGHYRLKAGSYNGLVENISLEPKDAELPSIKDMICSLSPPIDLLRITEKDVGKYKVVRGLIEKSRTGVNKRCNMQGYMTLVFGQKRLNIAWWNAPEFAIKYNIGSEVYVVCDIQKTEQYGLSGIGHFVIPIHIAENIPTFEPSPDPAMEGEL
jgi:hypothetical protein